VKLHWHRQWNNELSQASSISCHTVQQLCMCVSCECGNQHVNRTCCRTFEGGSCADVNKALVAQMKKWESADNCHSGGEKCLYSVMSCLSCM